MKATAITGPAIVTAASKRDRDRRRDADDDTEGSALSARNLCNACRNGARVLHRVVLHCGPEANR